MQKEINKVLFPLNASEIESVLLNVDTTSRKPKNGESASIIL